MSHSEECPVCKGKGTKNMPGTWFYYNPFTGDKAPQEPCNGCQGKGYVIVS